MVRESAVRIIESAMKMRNCAARPTPRTLASAAASAPTPNQSSTKPGVKTSAMMSTTPRIVQRIQMMLSISVRACHRMKGARNGARREKVKGGGRPASPLKKVFHDDPDVRGPLARAAHKVRIPGFAVRDVDAHAVTLAPQPLL